MREFSIKDAAARAARPEQFVDLTFIKELDASGFIDNLYKTAAVAKRPADPAPIPPASRETSAQIAGKAKTIVAEEKSKPAKAPAEKVTSAPVAVALNRPAAGPQYHIVKTGDTVSKIADQHYNSIHQWARIYEANKDTVKNPHYIYIGMKLVIPPPNPSGG